MTGTLIFLAVVMAIISLIFAFWTIADWQSHWAMTKGCTKQQWGYGNHKDFVREFNKHEWKNEGRGGTSLWDRENNCQIHAGIYKFNDIGMVLRTPWDFLMIRWFIRNYCKPNPVRHDWSVEHESEGEP